MSSATGIWQSWTGTAHPLPPTPGGREGAGRRRESSPGQAKLLAKVEGDMFRSVLPRPGTQVSWRNKQRKFPCVCVSPPGKGGVPSEV